MIEKQISRIAFFELEEWEKEHIKADFPDIELKLFSDKLSIANVKKIRDCDALGVFIYSKVSKEILDNLPNLKLITTMSTGFDHIDIDECAIKGIPVCNVPTYGANTVAEHTFALILTLSRKLVESVDRTRKGNFTIENLRGFDIRGKTIGIIGCGDIGEHVAKIARGFEMDVIVFDVNKDMGKAKELGFRYVEFDELLAKSDIISLHAPYNKHTHHMINKENIQKIKKGAYLINTARGGLVETEALYNALKEGILAGAGIDVIEEEYTIKEEKELLSPEFMKACNLKTVLANHMLMHMDNVIITPHNAFNSKEALTRIMDVTVANVRACMKGKCINKVAR